MGLACSDLQALPNHRPHKKMLALRHAPLRSGVRTQPAPRRTVAVCRVSLQELALLAEAAPGSVDVPIAVPIVAAAVMGVVGTAIIPLVLKPGASRAAAPRGKIVLGWRCCRGLRRAGG